MKKKNAYLFAIATVAALIAGAAVWFLDGRATGLRKPHPPIGVPGPGGGEGQTGARADPPALALVPPFDNHPMTNTKLLTHYLQQIPLDPSPSLEQWQKVLDDMPKEARGSVPLTLPLGASHYVMALCSDLAGNLWIGTEGEGVFRYSPTQPAAEQWAQSTTGDGLGDDYGYSLACDHQGRIWVGHLNHGISVFNGQRWQNYEMVGGLSKPDTRSGPLGERVFKIAVCPLLDTGGGTPTFHDTLTGVSSSMAGEHLDGYQRRSGDLLSGHRHLELCDPCRGLAFRSSPRHRL